MRCPTITTQKAYGIMLLVLVLDQITKLAVLKYLGTTYPVTSFFNLVLVWNNGVSFGMLQHGHEAAPFLLSAMALGVCIALHRWLLKAENGWTALGLALVMGGAIGNVIDRMAYGAVVDFLDFHVNGFHWPAFNVADSSILIGVVTLLLGGSRKTA